MKEILEALESIGLSPINMIVVMILFALAAPWIYRAGSKIWKAIFFKRDPRIERMFAERDGAKRQRDLLKK